MPKRRFPSISIYLSIYRLIDRSIDLSICLSIYLSMYLSIYLPICPQSPHKKCKFVPKICTKSRQLAPISSVSQQVLNSQYTSRKSSHRHPSSTKHKHHNFRLTKEVVNSRIRHFQDAYLRERSQSVKNKKETNLKPVVMSVRKGEKKDEK